MAVFIAIILQQNLSHLSRVKDVAKCQNQRNSIAKYKNHITLFQNSIKQKPGFIRLFVNSLNKMFKKAGHIILSMMLLISTAGLAISKHYCGGELISTSLYAEADACCDSDDCCKNENEVFQLDEDFSVSTALEIPESVQIDLFAVSMVVFSLTLEEDSIAEDFELIDSPPPPNIHTTLALRQTYLL